MDGDKFLQTSHLPEAEHRPFSSSKRLVRILRAIYRPATGFLLFADTELTQGRPIKAGSVRHDINGRSMPLQGFSQEFQCRFLVPGHCYETLDNLTLMINNPP
jgi:hypothetical protein